MPKKPVNKDIHGIEDASNPTIAPKGNNYLLIIGIDKYVYCPPLQNAVKDAKELVDVLKKRFRFEEQHITTLYDEEANKGNIYNAFRKLATLVKPVDNLVIYFSGHGEYDKIFNLGYWVPIEAEKSKVDQYIPNSEIRNILAAIKSHHTFLMVDSCFSGALFAQGADRNISLRKERDPSRWGLTAGRNEIVTDGIKGTNSPFAQSIIYQLKNTEESIGVAELCDNVLEVVSANANQTPRGEPLKVRGHQGGQFVFHLKLNELGDWQNAQELNTKKSYQSFINQYPNSKYMAAAKMKLVDVAFDDISKMPDEQSYEIRQKINAINAFLSKDLTDQQIRQAEDLGEHLDYKEDFLNAQSNLFSLRKFARKDTPFKEAAKAKLVELETQPQTEEVPISTNESKPISSKTTTNTDFKENKGKVLLGCLIMLIVGSFAFMGINGLINDYKSSKATPTKTRKVEPVKTDKQPAPPTNAPAGNAPPGRTFTKPINTSIVWSGKDQLSIDVSGGIPPYKMHVKKGNKTYNDNIKYPKSGKYVFNINAAMKADYGIYDFVIFDRKGDMQTIQKRISSK